MADPDLCKTFADVWDVAMAEHHGSDEYPPEPNPLRVQAHRYVGRSRGKGVASRSYYICLAVLAPDYLQLGERDGICARLYDDPVHL